MNIKLAPWSIGRALLLTAVLACSGQAATAAVAPWKGQTPEAKVASDAEVRLSVLGFTEPDKAKAVVTQYQQYLTNHNAQEFVKFLQQQDTKGYLFTKEAVGYSIKYAWQSDDKANRRMVLLVEPALMSRNPYQWKKQIQSTEPFTLVEVNFAGDEAIVSTSLDTPIAINAQGQLELKTNDKSSVFVRMKDDTPYYLK